METILDGRKRRNSKIMTPEQKLNHLKAWMGNWVDIKIITLCYEGKIHMYDISGLVCIWRVIKPIPFEKYLQLIENQ